MIGAAVDIGSTSTRLLIGSAAGDGRRLSRITHLARGLGDRGDLDPTQRQATLDCLGVFAAEIRSAGVGAVAAVATSSIRRAHGGEDFLDAAAEVLGVRPIVLDGAAEARLAFVGATRNRPDHQEPFVVVDLGGGSCEFGVGRAGAAPHVFSAEFGAARLTERFIEHDPPRPEELVACLSVVAAHLDDVRRELPAVTEATTWFGLAGTFTTLAAVELGLARYDRDRVDGFRLTREAAEDVFRTVVTEPLADRIHNPGLDPERAHAILGGACAAVAIYRFFGLDEMVISDADLLDGLLVDLLA